MDPMFWKKIISGMRKAGDLKASFRQCGKYSLFFIHLQPGPKGLT